MTEQSRSQAKQELSAALEGWPAVEPDVATFVAGLHWRIRQAVTLTHAER